MQRFTSKIEITIEDKQMEKITFDIKKMTEQFNKTLVSASCFIDYPSCRLTAERMSEMIVKHAEKLGYKCVDDRADIISSCHIMIFTDGGIEYYNRILNFDNHRHPEIGLEFFSIKPEPKMVTVRMPEKDYNTYNATAETFEIDKWELVKCQQN